MILEVNGLQIDFLVKVSCSNKILSVEQPSLFIYKASPHKLYTLTKANNKLCNPIN